jgi:hypothetical protein
LQRTVILAHFRVAIASSILFACCIALIRAQPYDAADLRALLTSESCSAPCFMGIRPGVTTMDEALELLRTSEWVRYIRHIDLASATLTYSGGIRWEWSGRQPSWIDARHDSWIWMIENRVDYITIRTRVSLGDIWLAYGAPNSGTVFSDVDARLPTIYYEAIYPRDHMFVTVGGVCPIRNYWSEAALIAFRLDMPPRLPASPGGSGLPGSITPQCVQLLE